LIDAGASTASQPEAVAASPRLLSFNASEVGENQFRQILAATPFEQTEHRHSKFTQRLTQPVKILRFERSLRQRVARVRIEPGGHRDEFGMKPFRRGESACVICRLSLELPVCGLKTLEKNLFTPTSPSGIARIQ
jgi:hypothetical protein